MLYVLSLTLRILIFVSVPFFKTVEAYQNPKKLYEKRGKVPVVQKRVHDKQRAKGVKKRVCKTFGVYPARGKLSVSSYLSVSNLLKAFEATTLQHFVLNPKLPLYKQSHFRLYI